MEIEVCNRIKSICFREENIFRKYYRYSNDPSVEREAKIANILKEGNFPVAMCYKTGYSEEKRMRYNEFEFVDITSINENDLNKELVSKTIELIKNIQSIKYSDDNYWESLYEKDLIRCLGYNEELKIKALNYLNDVKHYPRKFMHGDFSLKNFGYKKNTKELFLYDFQTACNGPVDWDIAYFMATLPVQYSNLFEYDEKVLTMIKIISAVRLGRGSRRNLEVEKRKQIQEYWWNIND